ncbi:MAG: 16S rRNA (adenine(1518)-N(6)/adenine(1519)-N(6))-dimethyltransferase RsmA [Christensenellaceae bacterium]|jgi:16S rRNA (adenine1518-N6/adenine1519-N6)-dimethyltransferase
MDAGAVLLPQNGILKMNVTSRSDITRILNENGLSPLKRFGQNFLVDGNITRKIAESTGAGSGDCVFEIGTGLGALTKELLTRAEKVLSVEIDDGLFSLVQTSLGRPDNLLVLHQDILKTDIRDEAGKFFQHRPFFVCGNLPYYITSKILMKLLESQAPILGITVMVQKEVAMRLTAQKDDPNYGAITASCNYFAQPEYLFTVSKNCFYPVPDVDSAVLRLNMKEPFYVPRKKYETVVRAAFAMRRKTIFNNLKQLKDAKAVSGALEKSRIPERARAQEISPEEFCTLTKNLYDL